MKTVDKWIDVRDKVPKIVDHNISQTVLIALRHRSDAKPSRNRPSRLVVSIGYLVWDRLRDSMFWHDCTSGDTITYPKYWQPMPEPPEEKDDARELDRHS